MWTSSRDRIVVDEVDAIGVFSGGLDMVVGRYGVGWVVNQVDPLRAGQVTLE